MTLRKFKVYTEMGDWEIYAASADEARRVLYGITDGRCGHINQVQEVA